MLPLTEKMVDQQELAKGIAFHEALNPKLFDDNDEMLPEVRITLLRAAKAFYDFLDVPGLHIEDIIFTGSNAAYNYTKFSDIDIHLVVDFASCPELAENLFMTKKNLWNETHDVTVRGYPLEMYVENVAEPVTAQGVYSLKHGEWVKKPQPIKPEWDDGAVAAKVENIAERIDDLLSGSPTKKQIDSLSNKIRRMRKAGLESGGEFSIENLAFKGLRNLGFLDRLWKARVKIEDRVLSLETEFNEGQ